MNNFDVNGIRVIIVDDSSLMREIIKRGLEAEKDIVVIASCSNCDEAREVIKSAKPDAIALDHEMPGMNGLEFLKEIMQANPIPVIMVSTTTRRGAEITLNALENGAIDVVEKPSGREGVALFVERLRKSVRGCEKFQKQNGLRYSSLGKEFKNKNVTLIDGNDSVIAIGSSTGGVAALQVLLKSLPINGPPIVVTQHMPSQFLFRFSERLNSTIGKPVSVASDGDRLMPGRIYLAPGDAHLTVELFEGKLVSRLQKGAPISGHIPSVDALFGSVSRLNISQSVGIILTGMGKDGANGLLSMKESGSLCLGQSEESCMVYGMPRAAFELGAVHQQLDLKGISDRVCRFFNDSSAMKVR